MSRPVIGRCTDIARTHRTLESAFGCGPHNRPALGRRASIDMEWVIGAVCVAIVLILPVLSWKGII